MSIEHAVVVCSRCGEAAEHELRYAGRLLDKTRCLRCGHLVEVEQRVLLPAYLHDLEKRVTSNPGRLISGKASSGVVLPRAAPGHRPPAGKGRQRALVVGQR